MILDKKAKFNKRQKKVRSKILRNLSVPRLSIFRSNKHLHAQIIDDKTAKTLVSVKDSDIKKTATIKTPTDSAKELGVLIAKKAVEKNIKNIAFDRSGYRYHGKVKAVAEGAREGGLKF